MRSIRGQLILQAHDNLTRKKGRPDYAPTFLEIENEINENILQYGRDSRYP